METDQNKAVETKEVPPAATEPIPELLETGPTGPVEDTVDYKAELEASQARETKLKTERDNYKAGLLTAKGKRPDDGSVIVSNTREFNAIIEQRVAELAGSLAPTVDQVLDTLTDNTDERELIRHIYDTRIQHSGIGAVSLKNDLEEAQLLANKKTVQKTISELRLAAQQRPTPGSGAGASTVPTAKTGDPDFTPEQLAYFAQRKINPDKVRENLKKTPVFSK